MVNTQLADEAGTEKYSKWKWETNNEQLCGITFERRKTLRNLYLSGLQIALKIIICLFIPF